MAKMLKIDTVAGNAKTLDVDDELLLTNLDGHEGVSIPFSYDLTLVRHPKKGPLPDLYRMIGSSARVGLLRPGQADFHGEKYIYRLGCFSQFEIVNQAHEERRLVYKARLIPAVMLWGGGVRFRVFEKMNVVDIIDKVLKDIRSHNADARFDLSRLNTEDFPKVAYCVQFRESDFGFVCRLMAQHGISYFFDQGKTNKWGEPAENETLVLVRPNDQGAKLCDIPRLNALNLDAVGGKEIKDQITIANLNYSLHTSRRNAFAGNFNLRSPTNPLRAEPEVPIAPPYDIMAAWEGAPHVSVLRREEFPASADVDPYAKPANGNRFIDGYAKEMMHQEEVEVFKVSGLVKNASFVAGRKFKILKDEAHERFDQREFLITLVKINAIENSYMSSTGQDALDFCGGLANAFIFNLAGSSNKLDATTAVVNSAWSNYLTNEQTLALAKWRYGDRQRVQEMRELLVLPELHGGVAGLWTSLFLSNFGNAMKDVIRANQSKCTIQFGAVEWGKTYPKDEQFYLWPRVSAPRPVAAGPHFATVVGPPEKDEGDEGMDPQLGRVRVRFPWHQHPGHVDFSSPSRPYPFDSDKNTAWVPVCHGWAGERRGIQFMPRVGDHVMVEFIDGDPERPVITGCLYRAGNESHLPFLNEADAKQQITAKSLFEATLNSGFTLSGIETRSTPKPKRRRPSHQPQAVGQAASVRGELQDTARICYHLLRFDDNDGDEQLLMRSQGRLDVTAKCCHYETTEGNRHVRVVAGKDADGKTVGGGSSFTTVGGESDERIGGSRYEAVDKDYQLTVKGKTQFDLKGDWINVVGGKLSLNAATIVIEAAQKLTLKVGGSTVVLNPCGVYLDGAMIHNQGGGPADTAANAQIKDVADASKADPGEPAYMRTEMPGGCKGGGGSGGKRGEHTVPAQHGLPCTLDSEQMICLPLAQLCTADGGGG